MKISLTAWLLSHLALAWLLAAQETASPESASAEPESAIANLADKATEAQTEADSLAQFLENRGKEMEALIEKGAKLDQKVIELREKQEEELHQMETASAPARAEEARKLLEALERSRQATQQAVELQMPPGEAGEAWQRLRQLESAGDIPQGAPTGGGALPISPGQTAPQSVPWGRFARRVPGSLSGPAWSQLESLAGISQDIQGTPEYIHETASQGFDTAIGHRHRELRESDIRVDTLLQGAFRGPPASSSASSSLSTEDRRFETSGAFFRWAKEQHAGNQQKLKSLVQEMGTQAQNTQYLDAPLPGRKTVRQHQGEIQAAKDHLEALKKNKKSAEADSDYYNDLDLRERKPLQEIGDMLKRIYDDWNSLSRTDSTQTDIDAFIARNPECQVSRNERQEGERLIINWNLDTISGKSSDGWNAQKQTHYERALEYYNKSKEARDRASSSSQQIGDQNRHIWQLEDDMQAARKRLGEMEAGWRAALDAVRRTLSQLNQLRLEYDVLYITTEKIVSELEKVAEEY